MTKLKFSYLLLLLIAFSCTTEKVNLSPVESILVDSNDKIPPYTAEQKKNLIFYSSELTNMMTSFPKLGNDAVNNEIFRLKSSLKDYIGAMEEFNVKQLHAAEKNYEKSYKKLQNLRKFLNTGDDEVLNRYLVRIKTNMSLLNSNIPQN